MNWVIIDNRGTKISGHQLTKETRQCYLHHALCPMPFAMAIDQTYQTSRNHETAINKARAEYEKYRAIHTDEPSPVERHFIAAVNEMKQLEKKRGPRTPGKRVKGKKG